MYQIENKGSEECGAMPSDVDDASALPAQLGRNELDRVLEARVYSSGGEEATGHGQHRYQHGRT